jgi:hypothetical protein
MGRYELASYSFGIRIKLGALVEQTNSRNHEQILDWLQHGFVEDENECYNAVFQSIMNGLPQTSWPQQKGYLRKQLQKRGNLFVHRWTGVVEEDNRELLWNHFFLCPVVQHMETVRWGWHRDGTNASSKPLASSAEIFAAAAAEVQEEFAGIHGVELVQILRQQTS